MFVLHDKKEMRNQKRMFYNRYKAGEMLGSMLESRYEGDADVLILAIPMGGIPVALRIREKIGCSLDFIIVRKIQIPGNPEAGFGAMTHEGDIFLNEALMANLDLKPDQIERLSTEVGKELEYRNRMLRGDRSFPELENKTVIIVDDGLASGYTMKASVYMVSKRKAARKVIAIPTASRKSILALKNSVDEIYCPNIREDFSYAVADAYENWRDVSDTQVFAMLKTAGILAKPYNRGGFF